MVGPLGGNQGFPAVHLKENCSFLYSGSGTRHVWFCPTEPRALTAFRCERVSPIAHLRLLP
jgi:hypothetical protein